MCLAIPGRIETLQEAPAPHRAGRVSFGGITKEVNLSFVPGAGVGDYVIVHVGVALSQVDEQEAQRTFQYLEELGELGELGP
jgi:hydrogenase expression/formation protein HypC